MAYLVKLPPLGEGIFEAQVIRIHAYPGDVLQEGDVIAEMETDKATGVLASPVNGTIKEYYVELGDYIFRNEKILLIDDGKEEVTSGAGADGGRVTKDGTIVPPPADENLAEAVETKIESGPNQGPVKTPTPAKAPVNVPQSEIAKAMAKAAQSAPQEPKPEEKSEVPTEAPEEEVAEAPETASQEVETDEDGLTQEERDAGVQFVEKLGSAKEIFDFFAGVEKAAAADAPKPDMKFMLEQGQAQQGEPKAASARKHRYLEPLDSNFMHSLDGSQPIPTHISNQRTVEDLLKAGEDVNTVPALRQYAAENHIDISELPVNEEGIVTKEIIDYAISHAVGEREWNYNLIDEWDPGYWTHRPEDEQGREETYIRKYNASRFEMSHRKAPPFSVQVSVDVTKLHTYIEIIKGEGNIGNSPYIPYLIQAICAACYRFPELNASIDDIAAIFRFKSYVNVGIEMNTVKGLFTPVVRDANKQSIEELESNIAALEHEVKIEGVFNYDSTSDGTITVTDLSEFGEVDRFVSIIHYPEAAIFGIGKPVKRPVVVDDQVVIRPMMPMTLVVDHRILTRDKVVRIANYVKEMLEEPSVLFSQEYE